MNNAPLTEPNDKLAPPEVRKSWIGSVCAYFRDFLDTDFKKTRTPKRSIVARDTTGVLTGISLTKYPDLELDLWQLISRPFESSMTIDMPIVRGKYRSRISKQLLDVINRQVDSTSDKALQTISAAVRRRARELRSELSDDPERYGDTVISDLRNRLLLEIVNPLLSSLATYFAKRGDVSIDTIYNLEEELGAYLTASIREPISFAIATAIVENNFGDLDELVLDVCEANSIRQKFTSYFSDFTSNDFFRDLSELRSTLKLKNNFQIYLYLGALRYSSTAYPIFYLPLQIALQDSTLTISFDPHILVNKKAIDFAVGEVARALGHHVVFTLEDRIVHVGEGESLLSHCQRVLDDLTSALTMDGAIDLHDTKRQAVRRMDVSIDNSLHFAAFDQADESLLNDYEELLNLLDGNDQVARDFEQLLTGFMYEEPISIDAVVDEQWAQLSLPDRLVYESPVPLNEEQRKILSGLSQPECRFIAVEGPPGTGKSHTITACVFDAILRNRNVLVLSDKKEALDVVESKIRSTLRTVRLNEKLQDPVLRLGKHGNTYNKILSTKSIEELKRSQKVAKSNQAHLAQEIEYSEQRLRGRIGTINEAVQAIDIKAIAALQRKEAELESLATELDHALSNSRMRKGLRAAHLLHGVLRQRDIAKLLRLSGCPSTTNGFGQFLSLVETISAVLSGHSKTQILKSFGTVAVKDIPTLGDVIEGFQKARMPIFGYLFAKNRVIELDRQLNDTFDRSSTQSVKADIPALQEADSALKRILSQLRTAGIEEEKALDFAFHIFLNDTQLPVKYIPSIRGVISNYLQAIEVDDIGTFGSIGLAGIDLEPLLSSEATEFTSRLELVAEIVNSFDGFVEQFNDVPEVDYAADLVSIESLHTQRLADVIDARVVEFADNKRNAARQIRDIIKKKQKFPRDLFEHLRDAFPVIIAGIRDYAEFVPLEQDLFDLIIIDEASQVSIAQALPAFLRAKKVLVLGDRNQFSNVKTSNASIAMNQAYKGAILQQFKAKEDGSASIAALNQVQRFDIKTSVLDFVESIANLKVMLRKHFRGYPELISFSSKHFYGGNLQAVKIRGKPVDDILKFTMIEHDGRLDPERNTNTLETVKIVELLRQLASAEDPPDVIVITPFSAQQRSILRHVQMENDGQDLIERLKFRVFTFDTCQGEEAAIVIYSMTAHPTTDRLNHIFPSDLSNPDEVDGNLRLQRLNVGFSRARECIHILHSKPLEDFNSSVRIALQHFENELQKAQVLPEFDDLDPNSPMEAHVLNWLQQTPIVDELEDKIEIDAQFELGAYLRQLDPTYQHPNYRVDFLIKVQGKSTTAQIIIEYDGFKEHFTNLAEVDADNYATYMKPEDVERQKVLEGYGYRFLRINRFNMGPDPVKTLDERLRRLIEKIDIEASPPTLIEEHKRQQQALSDGDAKACGKCGEVKEIEHFFDQSLKRGVGGYGRICDECKGMGAGRGNKRKSRNSKPTAPDASGRVYLHCPYSQKDACKRLGGRWDPIRKRWYVPNGTNLKPFAKWIS